MPDYELNDKEALFAPEPLYNVFLGGKHFNGFHNKHW